MATAIEAGKKGPWSADGRTAPRFRPVVVTRAATWGEVIGFHPEDVSTRFAYQALEVTQVYTRLDRVG